MTDDYHKLQQMASIASDIPVSSTGLKCGMKGFKGIVQETVDLTLFVIPLGIEVVKTILPDDLKKAIDHFYLGMTGVSLWIGYVVAAVYYLLLDEGYGQEMCEALGIGWVVVDTLHAMLDWSDDGVGEEEPPETIGDNMGGVWADEDAAEAKANEPNGGDMLSF